MMMMMTLTMMMMLMMTMKMMTLLWNLTCHGGDDKPFTFQHALSCAFIFWKDDGMYTGRWRFVMFVGTSHVYECAPVCQGMCIVCVCVRVCVSECVSVRDYVWLGICVFEISILVVFWVGCFLFGASQKKLNLRPSTPWLDFLNKFLFEHRLKLVEAPRI